MERSTAFDFAGSIERAAEIVTEGTAFFTPEYLAGQYAYEGARDGEGDVNDADTLAANLDYLAEAGAEFNKSKALNIAMEFVAAAE